MWPQEDLCLGICACPQPLHITRAPSSLVQISGTFTLGSAGPLAACRSLVTAKEDARDLALARGILTVAADGTSPPGSQGCVLSKVPTTTLSF